MSKFYVAYGSNLNKAQMRRRCPSAKPYASGVLMGYQLLFKGSMTGAYATVEPMSGASVPVGVWEINERDEKSLDRYEGFPNFYYKKTVTVETDLGAVDGMVYVMNEDRPFGTPSQYYVNTCLKGYDDFDLDKLAFIEAYLGSMIP